MMQQPLIQDTLIVGAQLNTSYRITKVMCLEKAKRLIIWNEWSIKMHVTKHDQMSCRSLNSLVDLSYFTGNISSLNSLADLRLNMSKHYK